MLVNTIEQEIGLNFGEWDEQNTHPPLPWDLAEVPTVNFMDRVTDPRRRRDPRIYRASWNGEGWKTQGGGVTLGSISIGIRRVRSRPLLPGSRVILEPGPDSSPEHQRAWEEERAWAEHAEGEPTETSPILIEVHIFLYGNPAFVEYYGRQRTQGLESKIQSFLRTEFPHIPIEPREPWIYSDSGTAGTQEFRYIQDFEVPVPEDEENIKSAGLEKIAIGIKLKNYDGQVLAGDTVRAPKGATVFSTDGKKVKLRKSKTFKVTHNNRKGINKYRLNLVDSSGKKFHVMNYMMDDNKKPDHAIWSFVRKGDSHKPKKKS